MKKHWDERLAVSSGDLLNKLMQNEIVSFGFVTILLRYILFFTRISLSAVVLIFLASELDSLAQNFGYTFSNLKDFPEAGRGGHDPREVLSWAVDFFQQNWGFFGVSATLAYNPRSILSPFFSILLSVVFGAQLIFSALHANLENVISYAVLLIISLAAYLSLKKKAEMKLLERYTEDTSNFAEKITAEGVLDAPLGRR